MTEFLLVILIAVVILVALDYTSKNREPNGVVKLFEGWFVLCLGWGIFVGAIGLLGMIHPALAILPIALVALGFLVSSFSDLFKGELFNSRTDSDRDYGRDDWDGGGI